MQVFKSFNPNPDASLPKAGATKEQELTPEPANVKSKESKRTNGGENLTSKGLEEVEAPYVEDLVSDEDKAEQEETRGAFKDCHEIG